MSRPMDSARIGACVLGLVVDHLKVSLGPVSTFASGVEFFEFGDDVGEFIFA